MNLNQVIPTFLHFSCMFCMSFAIGQLGMDWDLVQYLGYCTVWNCSNFSPWYNLTATLNWHVIDTCQFFFLFIFSPFSSSLQIYQIKKISLSPSLSLQQGKFVVESLSSSSLNLHGCSKQPPSLVHHHLRRYLVWCSPLLRPLSLEPSRASACIYITVASSASHRQHHLS